MNRHPLRSFFLLPLLGLTGCLATHGAPADPVPPPPTLRAGELPRRRRARRSRLADGAGSRIDARRRGLGRGRAARTRPLPPRPRRRRLGAARRVRRRQRRQRSHGRPRAALPLRRHRRVVHRHAAGAGRRARRLPGAARRARWPDERLPHRPAGLVRNDRPGFLRGGGRGPGHPERRFGPRRRLVGRLPTLVGCAERTARLRRGLVRCGCALPPWWGVTITAATSPTRRMENPVRS